MKISSKKWINASGKLVVAKDSIRVVLDSDFCAFYSFLYKKFVWNTVKTNLPRHGAHINIVSEKIHKNVDCSRFLKRNGEIVKFSYNVEGNFGGFSKGFKNFWFDVESKKMSDIADDLGIFQKKSDIVAGFARFHITIFNTKNL